MDSSGGSTEYKGVCGLCERELCRAVGVFRVRFTEVEVRDTWNDEVQEREIHGKMKYKRERSR